MEKQPAGTGSGPIALRSRGQETWYLLTSLLAAAGLLAAFANVLLELGLVALFLAGLSFGIGILVHSSPR